MLLVFLMGIDDNGRRSNDNIESKVLTKGETKSGEEIHSTVTAAATTTTTSSGLTTTTTTSPYISHCAFQFQWVNKL